MKQVTGRTKIIAALIIAAGGLITLLSFKSTGGTTQYMEVTTIESIIPGGLGRSRMVIVGPDGKTDIKDMKNLYSMVGINFDNISGNVQATLDEINSLTSQGWSLTNVYANSESPGGDSKDGIFMTKYLFQKTQ
jgi:hypothetical protein